MSAERPHATQGTSSRALGQGTLELDALALEVGHEGRGVERGLGRVDPRAAPGRRRATGR